MYLNSNEIWLDTGRYFCYNITSHITINNQKAFQPS